MASDLGGFAPALIDAIARLCAALERAHIQYAIILLKLTAARPQDVADIAALLSSNRGLLDLAWIEQEWCAAFEADDPRWQRFQEAVHEYYEQ